MKQTYTNRYFNWGLLIPLVVYFLIVLYTSISIFPVDEISVYIFLNDTFVSLILSAIAITTLFLPKVKAEKYVQLWWIFTFLIPLLEAFDDSFISEKLIFIIVSLFMGVLILVGMIVFSKDRKERSLFQIPWLMQAMAIGLIVDTIIQYITIPLVYQRANQIFEFSVWKNLAYTSLIIAMAITGWLLHKQKLKQIPALTLFGVLLVLYFFGGRIIGLIL